MTSTPSLSFVIPTFNEAAHIGDVIDSIRDHVGTRFTHEIIVVDNGSTDGTVAIATGRNVDVLTRPKVTVAALRNAGAAQARADVFVFIDGDVLLTGVWSDHLPTTLAQLRENPEMVTGSRCGISRANNWIELSWFKPLLTEQPNYINSGHLITSRRLFERLGGFDAKLETGEDSDFSQRARTVGARIVNNPALEVIHEGYPKTLGRFIRRERWHGRGNFQTVTQIFRSKIGPLTLLFVLLHAGIVGALIAGCAGLAALAALSIAAFCLFSSWRKYRRPLTNVLVNGFLYYWYFFGRALALFSILGKTVRRPFGGR